MLKEIVQNLNVRFLTVDSYLGGTFILGIPKKAKFDTFVGSIPPILNFIPLPSHQEVYCNSAKKSQRVKDIPSGESVIFWTTVEWRVYHFSWVPTIVIVDIQLMPWHWIARKCFYQMAQTLENCKSRLNRREQWMLRVSCSKFPSWE